MKVLARSLIVYSCLQRNVFASYEDETPLSRLDGIGSAGGIETPSANRSTLNGKKILTFPLIPHHEVHARRRRELGLAEDELEINSFDSRILEEERIYHPVGTLYQGYGTHYVDLWVGTPNPARQTVIVDTGSSITAFPCEGCKDCGEGKHIDDLYPFSKSQTFSKLKCDSCGAGFCDLKTKNYCKLSMSYQEGSSWKAFEGIDTVYFGGPHTAPSDKNRKLAEDSTELVEKKDDVKKDNKKTAEEEAKKELDTAFKNNEMANHAKDYSFQLRFGCQYAITGLFKTQLADGIMGMENSKNSFWRQMHEAKVIDEKKFSLCYSKANTSSREGSFAGVITLGGADERLHTSPMVYAQNLKEAGWFTVYIRAMYLSSNLGTGDVLKLEADYNTVNEEGIIIDSGTTDSYLPREFSSHFKKVFDQLSEVPLTTRLSGLKKDVISKFPSVLIQLSGAENVSKEELEKKDGSIIHRLAKELDPSHPNDVIMEIPPTHYFEHLASIDKWENRLHFTESSGGVIGANLMVGHNILFDGEKRRIGIAESDCNYSKFTNENPL